ncbi:beta-lactamase domain-containing protein [Xylogone sp. PMI_703]|nr:beta-lactamase domain-containing protein [Xylogone sp. PMI_703]
MSPSHSSPYVDDNSDFEQASRGFLGAPDAGVIKGPGDSIVYDFRQYAFLKDECPPTVNPKLWRHGQLLEKQGLYEVASGIYQVRGFDASNMMIIEGQTGVIVIDPLISNECAEAALRFYWKLRGNERPLRGLIYSHSHLDHFGGAQGVLGTSTSGSVPILAPTGFMEEALSENMMVGPAMRLRSAYMRWVWLPKSPTGQVGDGLCLGTSSGTHSFVPPTILIKETGEERTIDGVKMIFQSVPGTEAPAEINIHFPDHRSLYIAECATHCMHNILPLRGSQVRDARKWSQGLDETVALFGQNKDNIISLISEQRDFYAYLHDQTIRMANKGMTGTEIAEYIEIPEVFQRTWHLQGLYGSVNHNVKAIYQKYLGWFDGKPHNLWSYPAAEEGKRYVAAFGGIENVIKLSLNFMAKGDLRFACTLLSHATNSDPQNQESRDALASCYEKLGYGSENGTWRNFYLTGAHELRSCLREGRGAQAFNIFTPGLPFEQILATLGIKLNGTRAAKETPFGIILHLSEEPQPWKLTISNGAFSYRRYITGEGSNDSEIVEVHASRAQFLELLQKKSLVDGITTEGEVKILQSFVNLLEI